MNRREFVSTLTGGLVAIHQAPTFDLLIKGGRVIDPSQGLSAVRDVGIASNRIARVAPDIPETAAREILDARGKLVTQARPAPPPFPASDGTSSSDRRRASARCSTCQQSVW